MQRFRLLIISSNHGIRNGLFSLFQEKEGFLVVNKMDSLIDIEYLRLLQPDVVLCALFSHDEKSISIINILKQVCPCTLVIILSDVIDRNFILSSFAAGADGFLEAPILPADLVVALELSCRSSVCYCPRSVVETLTKLKGISKKRIIVKDFDKQNNKPLV